jgi:hypothetical protein
MGKAKAILVLVSALLLAGCCYDENGKLVSGDCKVKTDGVTFKCDGSSCGSNLILYTGTNVGVWSYKNSGSSSVKFDISVSDLPDKEITIVYTNEGTSNVNLPSISINTALKNEIYPDFSQTYVDDTFNYIPDEIKNFELPELTEQYNEPNFNLTPLYATWNVGNKLNWNVSSTFSPVSRAVTLKKQTKVSSRTVNIWVEDSEYGSGKIDDAKINEIASSISNVYTNVISLTGELWGTHRYSNLISNDQPLNMVFVNLNKDGQPFGTVGYFWARDNYLKTSVVDSNEALAMVVDTETYYLKNSAGIDGKFYILSTIAHELTHAANFYQRDVSMGGTNGYDTFLEEMTAVMMEDIISSKISYNDIGGKNGRYAQWLGAPLYHQNFADWKSSNVASYNVAGSFGAYLLRQYGTKFYKTLLKTSGSSISTIDNAIKVYDSDGLAKALRNWGASIAMFPAATAPKGFGYPEYSDNGFKLEAFDGNTYRQYRKLPTSSPSTLAPNAHFPFLRKTTSGGVYSESFSVPKGVGISVVIK